MPTFLLVERQIFFTKPKLFVWLFRGPYKYEWSQLKLWSLQKLWNTLCGGFLVLNVNEVLCSLQEAHFPGVKRTVHFPRIHYTYTVETESLTDIVPFQLVTFQNVSFSCACLFNVFSSQLQKHLSFSIVAEHL